jgi:hypothetical protein
VCSQIENRRLILQALKHVKLFIIINYIHWNVHLYIDKEFEISNRYMLIVSYNSSFNKF